MAVKAGAAGSGLTRTGFIQPSQDWTRSAWVYYPSTTPATYFGPWFWGNDYSASVWGISINAYVTGGQFVQDIEANGAIVTTPLSSAGWKFVGVRYTAATHAVDLFVGTVLAATVTADLSALPMAAVDALSWDGNGAVANPCGAAYDRVWQAALTNGELAIEAASVAAVRIANLLADTPLPDPTDLTDHSGHGRDWTVTGTLTYRTGPFATIPTNISPAAATVIAALPYTATQDVSDAPQGLTNIPSCQGNAYNAVWYRWTCPVGVNFVLVNGDRDPSSDAGYNPGTSVWIGSPSSLTLVSSSEATPYCDQMTGGYYFRLPVAPGTTYWFQFVNSLGLGPNRSLLLVRLMAGVKATAAIGAFVISDDADGFPAVVIAPDGTFKNYGVFPAGEFTATLPTGTLCTQNGTADTGVAILDSNWNTIATHDFSPERVSGIWSDQHAAFYVYTKPSGTPSPYHNKLYKVDSVTGAILHTTELTAGAGNTIRSAAVSQDGQTFYAGRTGGLVDVWNLVTDTLTTTWAVALAVNYDWMVKADGWTISDGSVFLPTQNTILSTTQVVKLNSVTGAIQRTYASAIGNVGRANRVCYINDTYFGVWGDHVPTGQNPSYLQYIAIADGSLFSETPPIGVSGGSVETVTANQPNVISNSCPVFVLAQLLVAGARTRAVIASAVEGAVFVAPPSPVPTSCAGTQPLIGAVR